MAALARGGWRTAYAPHEYPPNPGLDERHTADNDPVHQPWCQLGGVVGLEGFVGGEDGEEEARDGAGGAVSRGRHRSAAATELGTQTK